MSFSGLTIFGRNEYRICFHCKTGFIFKLSQLRKYKGGGKFCSRNCHYSYYRENQKEHPLYKPNGFIEKSGYRRIRNDEGKETREHRYLMEKYLGRKLKKTEHVHHINHNKSDNRLENLEVLSESDHHKKHPLSKETIRKIIVSRKKWYIEWKKTHWAKMWDRCVDCKTTKFKHQSRGFCSHCYLQLYVQAKS